MTLTRRALLSALAALPVVGKWMPLTAASVDCLTPDDVPLHPDQQTLMRCFYGEARSEPTEGILAVGCVIHNRVHRPPAS